MIGYLKKIKKEELFIGIVASIVGYILAKKFIFKNDKNETNNENTNNENTKLFRLPEPGVELRAMPNDEELTSRFKTIAGSDYDSYIESIKQIPLEPIIAIRQLYNESAFSPDVINCSRVSSAGARGIAQFMPTTWPAYSNGDPCNVPDSLKAHAKMMKDLIKKFPNRPDLALAGYNSGPYIQFPKGDSRGKYKYDWAFNNNIPFKQLKGLIPNESYKYSSSILRP
jgi:soluble lytic murein transglycosylase-like protein